MLPWQSLGKSLVPGEDKDIALFRRGDEFVIRIDGRELMSTRMHGSEEALAELGCGPIASRPQARVLIGGLGMGYTVAAALKYLGPDAGVLVAEVVPAVVTWNRGPLADLAERPLEDSRVRVRETDVARIIRKHEAAFDCILLDVDNGPRGLVMTGNDWLYTVTGLRQAAGALRSGGILAIWSAGPDSVFSKRFRQAGFTVTETTVRARGGRKGSRHTIWIGQTPSTDTGSTSSVESGDHF